MFLAILLVLLLFAVVLWLCSLALCDASIIDRFWGMGFVLVCGVGLVYSPAITLQQGLIAGLVGLWGIRLSIHLTWRNWGTGEDYRYRAMREKHGRSFTWKSFFTVFLLQAVLTGFISLPLQRAFATPAVTGLSPMLVAGTLLFLVGFFFETVGDWQLARFKAKPENQGQVMDRGLWRYTRHPNYFGDAVLWWGLFLIALPAPGVVYMLFSPIIMTLLLMKVSGVPLLEKRMAETRPKYAAYVEKTAAFVPWWPKA